MDGGEDFRSSLVENEGSCEGKITHFVKDLEGEYHECDEETNSPLASSSIANTTIQQPLSMQSCCTKLGSAIFHKKHLGLNVFLMWVVFCIPGNIVAVVLYLSPQNIIDPNHHQEIQFEEEVSENDNQEHFQCHEVKNDWDKHLAHSKFAIQGISVLAIGIPGFLGNLLSIVVLLQCKDNRNFHRLLAGLAIVDMLNLLNLIVEVAIIGEFMNSEPHWYKMAYPYFIHPMRGIIQTSAIFMVVAVATERYRAVIHVMSNRHSFYKYILVVLAFAVTLEFPRFFEMRIDKVNHDMQYVTTDIMENPYYVQFNSYWNELFVTGFVPLFTLCYMNLKMFFKIKDSSKYTLRFVANATKTSIERRHQNGPQNDPATECIPLQQMKSEHHQQRFTNGSIKSQNSVNSKSKLGPKKSLSGADVIKKKQEKSSAVLIGIIAVFLVCHMYRIALWIYTLALPTKTLLNHYNYCHAQGKYHIPVAIYYFTQLHHLFLVINSSVNFVIYCIMGRQFRKQLKKTAVQWWRKISH